MAQVLRPGSSTNNLVVERTTKKSPNPSLCRQYATSTIKKAHEESFMFREVGEEVCRSPSDMLDVQTPMNPHGMDVGVHKCFSHTEVQNTVNVS